MQSIFLILISLSLFPLLALARPSSAFEKCRENFIADTEKQNESLEARYQTNIGKSNRAFVLKAQSVSAAKTQKLVILLHGFMGSPDEMRPLGTLLQRRGYNVYSALIPGFGADANVANRFTHEQWSPWITREVNRAKSCFKEIHMAGFSTGGLLIHDYLLKHSQNSLIKSASLISPFFKVSGIFNSVVRDSASVILNKISVNTVYYALRFPDVEIMTIRRENYLQHIPIQSSDEILALARINSEKKPAGIKIQTPTLVLISEDDEVAEPEQTQNVTQKSFQTVSTVFYGKNHRARVPHHLLAHEISPVASDVEDRIIQHIEQSWP